MSFLGIRVPNDITRVLSEVEVPGAKEPRDHMHITICNLGKNVPIEQIVRVIMATYQVTSKTKPFTVRTNQVTSFSSNPDDGVPIIARIESDALHALRAALCASLDAHKVEYSKRYPEFKPHVTLAYSPDPMVDADKAADKAIPSIEWGVGEIVLWGGDSGDEKLTVTFPLSIAMTREAVYRAAVRLALNKKQAHDESGHCDPTCPCHGDSIVHRVASRFKTACGCSSQVYTEISKTPSGNLGYGFFPPGAPAEDIAAFLSAVHTFPTK